MGDDYQAWIDEHLGAWVRHFLQAEPQVAAGYNAAFQGDPVGAQWLTAAAAASPAAAPEPAPVAEAVDPAVAAPQVAEPVAEPVAEQAAEESGPVSVEALDDAVLAGFPEFATIDPERRRALVAEVFADAVG